MVAIVGVGFTLGGASKLLDPFFWERFENGGLFSLGATLDIFVGCFLVALPKWKVTRLVGIVLAGSYLLYLIRGAFLGVWTCSCFGGDSPIYYAMFFDIAALSVLCFASRSTRSEIPKFEDAMFYVSLVTIVVGLGFATNYFSVNRDLSFAVGLTETLNSKEATADAKWEGFLKLKNNSELGCEIVGVSNSCQFKCSSKLPVTLLPGDSTSLNVIIRLPESEHRENFTSGSAKLFVQFDTPSYAFAPVRVCIDTGCAAGALCAGGPGAFGCLIVGGFNCLCDTNPGGPGCYCEAS